jgi:molecular chaperone HscC
MPSANLDPDLVITMGAAIQAGLKAKDKMLDDVVLTDVCPYSLGTSVVNDSDATGDQGNLFSAIIERNTIIPASRTQRYWTSSDNQKEVVIDIYQGESRLVNNNINLGEIKVKIPKAKKAEESIDVRFSYDMNGLLEVDITVVSTGEKHYKMIENAPGELSEKEIQESKEKLSKIKFHPRELAVNQNLISRAERIFESRLADERDAIRDSLSWFEGILEAQDEKQISMAQQEFALFLDKFEQDGFF